MRLEHLLSRGRPQGRRKNKIRTMARQAVSSPSRYGEAFAGRPAAFRKARNAPEIFDMLGNKTYGNKERFERINQESNVSLAAACAVAEDKEIKLQFELETRKSIKGVRGMPWLSEATKDVTSCEKPRGGANGRRSAGVRMGEPAARKARHH